MTNNKLSSTRCGRKWGTHLANTLTLGRIIHYLESLEEEQRVLQKEILENAILTRNQFKPAMVWLISNKIIIETRSKDSARKYYNLNPKFRRLKNE